MSAVGTIGRPARGDPFRGQYKPRRGSGIAGRLAVRYPRRRVRGGLTGDARPHETRWRRADGLTTRPDGAASLRSAVPRGLRLAPAIPGRQQKLAFTGPTRSFRGHRGDTVLLGPGASAGGVIEPVEAGEAGCAEDGVDVEAVGAVEVGDVARL